MEPGRGPTTLLFFVVALLLGVAPARCHQHNVLNLVTYNTNLAIPDSSTDFRLADLQTRFTNRLFSAEADVICLQELQEVVHQEIIMAAAWTGGFRSSASFLASYDAASKAALATQPACNVFKFIVLGDCIQQQCGEKFGQDIRVLLNCVLTNCSQQLRLANLSQECINCVNAHGVEGIAGSSGLCFSNKTRLDFRPTYGLLMLSKYSLTNIVSRTFLDGASFFSRGYVRATVNGGADIGNWTAVCTHLYPSVSGVRYSGAFSSTEEENLNNTLAILSESLVRNSSRVVLMGDMNHGPANSENAVTAEFPRNYQTVLNSSYCSPYAEEDGNCTFCGRINRFLTLAAAATGVPVPTEILDHIYVKAPFLTCQNGVNTNSVNLTATRLFTEVTSVGLPLSDHYGVRVSITVPAEPQPTTVQPGSAAAPLVPMPLLLRLLLLTWACSMASL